MDTPGHVDFAYEVSRSLAACEGAVLVVDASQGVEAQTLANVYQALDNNLEILPVLNKVDLPAADADRVKQQIEDVIGLDASDAIPISAKTGQNVEAVLEAIVERLPPPKGDAEAPLKALLIDSWYDAYLGVVVLVRIIDGALKKGQQHQADGVGRQPIRSSASASSAPSRRCWTSSGPARSASSPPPSSRSPTRASATRSPTRSNPTAEALPGFKPAQPVVFCGLFPVDAAEFEDLREAMARLRLNDASFTYETETLGGAGLRLPLRLPRAAAPGDHHRAARARVQSRAHHHGAERHLPHLPHRRHDARDAQPGRHARSRSSIDRIEEPWIEATILVPDEYLGGVLKLCQDRRGRQKNLTYAGIARACSSTSCRSTRWCSTSTTA